LQLRYRAALSRGKHTQCRFNQYKPVFEPVKCLTPLSYDRFQDQEKQVEPLITAESVSKW